MGSALDQSCGILEGGKVFNVLPIRRKRIVIVAKVRTHFVTEGVTGYWGIRNAYRQGCGLAGVIKKRKFGLKAGGKCTLVVG